MRFPVVALLMCSCAPPVVEDEPFDPCALEVPATVEAPVVRDVGCPAFSGFNHLGRTWTFDFGDVEETREVRVLEDTRVVLFAERTDGDSQLLEMRCEDAGLFLYAERRGDDEVCLDEPRLLIPSDASVGDRFTSRTVAGEVDEAFDVEVVDAEPLTTPVGVLDVVGFHVVGTTFTALRDADLGLVGFDGAPGELVDVED